ncbi:E3 ubiquitin-protein ligase TRIM45-like [Porites lutea]|uniref:E3 ubiquitin-protein ligase TRIM45-like n=1 Tax=Porites lutea TaxID=51062 RepID=UPI003CC50508
MESLLKNLKEHVTCSICLDTFTDPKTITCLHTFCFECLKKHALMSQRNGKFRCPECQAEVDLPEANRFDKLPTSFHHNSLLSVLAIRQSGKGNDISCGVCKKKSVEISYCFECAKFMCSDCVNAHQLFSHFTQGHKVTPVKQFQPQDYEALMRRQSFCSQQYHEREVTRFFCLKCQICVCQICIATDHKAHDVEPLEKAADGEKANILTRTEVLKTKTKVFGDTIREYEQTVLELETNLTNAKREVSKAAEQMIAKIREDERRIITALENTCASRADKLDSAKAQVQSLLKQINQAIEFAENLIQRSSSSDVMQSKNYLEQRFNHLENAPIPDLPVNSFLKFYSTKEEKNLTLGYIATSEPVVGLTKDFQAGVESEFKVHTQILGEQVYEVKVLVEPADKIGSLTTYEKQDGDYTVKFTPKVPGIFNIIINVNGKDFAESPYNVQVKQRLIQVVGEVEIKGETLEKPVGIAVNSKGQTAVSDYDKHCILITDKERNCVRKVGCYGNNAGQLYRPADITYLNDDNILVADECNHRIQQFNVQTGNSVKSFGKKGTKDGEFHNPVSVRLDEEGRVIVTDYHNNRVQVLSQNGEPLFQFANSGPEKLIKLRSCIYHERKYIVSDWGSDCLKVFDNTGTFLYKIGEPGEGDGQFKGPHGLCLQKCGNHHNLLVCNSLNGRVNQFTVEGCFTGKTVVKLQAPIRITTTPDGLILVTDFKTKKIHILK